MSSSRVLDLESILSSTQIDLFDANRRLLIVEEDLSVARSFMVENSSSSEELESARCEIKEITARLDSFMESSSIFEARAKSATNQLASSKDHLKRLEQQLVLKDKDLLSSKQQTSDLEDKLSDAQNEVSETKSRLSAIADSLSSNIPSSGYISELVSSIRSQNEKEFQKKLQFTAKCAELEVEVFKAEETYKKTQKEIEDKHMMRALNAEVAEKSLKLDSVMNELIDVKSKFATLCMEQEEARAAIKSLKKELDVVSNELSLRPPIAEKSTGFFKSKIFSSRPHLVSSSQQLATVVDSNSLNNSEHGGGSTHGFSSSKHSVTDIIYNGTPFQTPSKGTTNANNSNTISSIFNRK